MNDEEHLDSESGSEDIAPLHYPLEIVSGPEYAYVGAYPYITLRFPEYLTGDHQVWFYLKRHTTVLDQWEGVWKRAGSEFRFPDRIHRQTHAQSFFTCMAGGVMVNR